MNSAEQKKIYIVHGYQASPNDHWFPWLGRKLQLAGHQSKRVMLAESNQPNFENWQKFLSVQITNLIQPHRNVVWVHTRIVALKRLPSPIAVK